MDRSWKLATSLALALTITACGAETAEEEAAPAAEPEPTTEAAKAPEATTIDPERYQVELENDRLRVVRIQYGPGEESVAHSHPDHVTVFLTDLDAEFTAPDGTVEPMAATTGSVLYLPAGSHQPRNVSDQDFEAVAIEIKPAGDEAGDGSGDPAGDEAAETGPDPVVVDPDHYSVAFENDRVRVVRIRYGAGEESVPHYHPEHLAVFLTDQHLGFSAPDGSSEEMRFAKGEHFLAPAGMHVPKNLGEGVAEVVIVELK